MIGRAPWKGFFILLLPILSLIRILSDISFRGLQKYLNSLSRFKKHILDLFSGDLSWPIRCIFKMIRFMLRSTWYQQVHSEIKNLDVHGIRFRGWRWRMSPKITSEQLPCLIEHSDNVVPADHFIEMHSHFVVIHLVAHNKVSVLKQKRNAQEHEERIAAAEFVWRRQTTFSQLIFTGTHWNEIH